MPKKFDGENSKAAVAKARKTAAKDAEKTKKEQEAENEYWRDDDKTAQKKNQRKEEKEKKKTEQLAKKAALKTLEEQELESIKVEPKQQSSKITRLQIQAETEKREAAARAATSAAPKVVPAAKEEEPIPENVNRLVVEGDEARTVDEAIKVLRLSDSPADVDRHPEKRIKAAYAAFEEKRLAQLRNQNPNMRLSQIKQMLHREWLKSPENPLNASTAKYNAKPA
uniref:EOG090X0J63 n=1 Tax=Moina brachiata TaxID=675436 RepID=A0A4Y7NJG5_9CRUS|nr:EOG090X0J63 [Moina brachiata]